jgi:hypothetical protein
MGFRAEFPSCPRNPFNPTPAVNCRLRINNLPSPLILPLPPPGFLSFLPLENRQGCVRSHGLFRSGSGWLEGGLPNCREILQVDRGGRNLEEIAFLENGGKGRARMPFK